VWRTDEPDMYFSHVGYLTLAPGMHLLTNDVSILVNNSSRLLGPVAVCWNTFDNKYVAVTDKSFCIFNDGSLILSRSRDHITPLLHEIDLLRILERTQFGCGFVTFASSYIANNLHRTNDDIARHHLCSTSSLPWRNCPDLSTYFCFWCLHVYSSYSRH